MRTISLILGATATVIATGGVAFANPSPNHQAGRAFHAEVRQVRQGLGGTIVRNRSATQSGLSGLLTSAVINSRTAVGVRSASGAPPKTDVGKLLLGAASVTRARNSPYAARRMNAPTRGLPETSEVQLTVGRGAARDKSTSLWKQSAGQVDRATHQEYRRLIDDYKRAAATAFKARDFEKLDRLSVRLLVKVPREAPIGLQYSVSAAIRAAYHYGNYLPPAVEDKVIEMNLSGR